MNDTTPEMAQKQVDIVLGFSTEKRLKIVLDMMEWGILMTRQRLASQFPDYTPSQLKFEQIKEYYGQEFTENQLLDIQKQLEAMA
jgi:Rv0078B-related antitoxin